MASRPLIALTGATGFVGSHLLTRLLDQGYGVRALVRSPHKVADIQHANLTWHKGSLTDDLSDFVAGCDIVLHIAGVIKARKRSDYFDINAHATGALAHQAEQSGVARFILLSSIAAQAPELSPYAASKRAGEVAISGIYTGKLAIIRSPAVFGPGDQATKPLFDMINKGVLPVAGGRGWRDRRLPLIYVEDLVKAVTDDAVTGQYDGQTVVPATISAVTWPDFADICAQALGHAVRPLALPLWFLFPLAGLVSALSRLFGIGHFTLGKLREFLYEDWQSGTVIQDATPLPHALVETAKAYEQP